MKSRNLLLNLCRRQSALDEQSATIRKFPIVQMEGARHAAREVNYAE